MRAAAALLTGALLLVACSGSGSKKTAAPTTSTATTTIPTSTTAAGPPACTTAGLAITVGEGNGAAGHIGMPIVFRNTSGARCVLSGYPGVAGVDTNGKQVAQARRTPRGFMTGGLPPGNDTPPLVSLAPGAFASAAIETTDVPTGNATTCPSYAGVLVTPPGETHSVQLKAQMMDCSGFEVHPVVPGDSGGIGH